MMNYVDALQLTGYPSWVKYGMWFSGLTWTVAYAVLFALRPDPVLSVDSVRRAQHVTTGRTAVEFQLRNTLKTPANIVSARFSIGEKPAGGLLADAKSVGMYRVVRSPDGQTLISQLEGADLAYSVPINRPFANVDYWEFELPLTESVDEQKTTRFAIAFDAGMKDIMMMKPLRVILRYNGRIETKAQEVP
jgi:hypothetical protein